MTTTVNLRKILDRKEWEMVAAILVTPGAPQVLAKSQLPDQLVLFSSNQAAGTTYLYRPDEDAWLMHSNPVPLAPAGGACMCHHPNGPTGTASAGTATTITTTTTAAANLAGYVVRITAGTGAGQERTIVSATPGANSVLTVAAWSVNPDNTSVYLLLTGRFYYHPGGIAGIRRYDVATDVWSAALAAPASVSSDATLIATPGYYGQAGLGTGMATGTATSGSATTIVNTGKAWATNQWANFQVRITAGTGAGKVATITSNTATTLTFPTVTTVLDATSVYIIEGNDDYLYLLGSAAVTLQRYSISANTWTTLTPSPTRTNASGAGGSGTTACWANVATDALFTAETAIVNGRRIYSFNALNTTLCLDYYDIPSNAWTNGVAIGRMNVGPLGGGAGACGVLIGDNWYLASGGAASTTGAGQVYRLNLPRQILDPWSFLSYPSVGANAGQRMFEASYTDGGTTMRWIYLQATGAMAWFRCLVV